MDVNLIWNFHNSVFALLILSVKLICSFYCSSERCSDPFLSVRALNYPEWICSWTSPTLHSYSTLRRIVSEDITSKWKVRVWSVTHPLRCPASLTAPFPANHCDNLSLQSGCQRFDYPFFLHIYSIEVQTYTESLYYTTQSSLCPQNQTVSQEMRCDQLHFIRVMHLKELHRDMLFLQVDYHIHTRFHDYTAMCLSLQIPIPMSLIR